MPNGDSAKLHLDCLPDATRGLLDDLRGEPEIGGFVLIGGTAIALHHGHRVSEDLDFLYPEPKLPRHSIGRIIQRLEAKGRSAELVTDANARLYWDYEGEDIDDHQQDWAIDGVKLTFIAADSRERGLEIAQETVIGPGLVRLLSSDGLFKLKSRLLMRRTQSRDLFDIWFYLDRRGKGIGDVIALIREENRHYGEDLIRQRLLPNRLSATDPGFAELVSDGPRDFTGLRGALADKLGRYDADIAARLLAKDLDLPE